MLLSQAHGLQPSLQLLVRLFLCFALSVLGVSL